MGYNDYLEKLQRLKDNGIDLNEYEEELMNEIAKEKEEKMQPVNISRKGVRLDPSYRELINGLKRTYYKDFYKKIYHKKWTAFEKETGLKYALEKCYTKVKRDERVYKALLEDPYMIKYIEWEKE